MRIVVPHNGRRVACDLLLPPEARRGNLLPTARGLSLGLKVVKCPQ